MSPSPRASIHVVAGVLIDAHDRVLIARRPSGKHLGGGWEFPGGKLEVGERAADGLKRELLEEIGVTVEQARPLIRIGHEYPERHVDLDVWLVTRFAGEPEGLEGQPIAWCPRESLSKAGLVPADKPVVTALRLPSRIAALHDTRYRIVDTHAVFRPELDERLVGVLCDSPLPQLADDLARALACGADFLLLPPHLQPAEIQALCSGLNVPVFAGGCSLEAAWQLGLTGVHELLR